MKREVTLYTAQKKKVLAGDYVEMAEYKPDSNIMIIGTDPLFAADVPEDTYQVVQLPIHRLCEDIDGELSCEYVALDLTLVRLIQAKEDELAVQKNRAYYWKNSSFLHEGKLKQVMNMSFWQKLKFAFTKTKETK